jgi:Na+-transporting methylmalonyl-CoA/oxaloacetate decarboxylase gamma subunit
MTKILMSLSLLFLVFSGTCFAQVNENSTEPPIEAPKTLEEGKDLIKKGGEKVVEVMPGVIKKIWREEAVPIWKGMWQWAKDIWKNYAVKTFNFLWYDNLKPGIKETIQFIKDEVREFIGKEVATKKPIIEEEFEKEKEEMKEEIPQSTHSLWQRFKNLFK